MPSDRLLPTPEPQPGPLSQLLSHTGPGQAACKAVCNFTEQSELRRPEARPGDTVSLRLERSWLIAERAVGLWDPPSGLWSPTKRKVFAAKRDFPRLYRALRIGIPVLRGGETARIPRDSFNKTKCPCLGTSTQETGGDTYSAKSLKKLVASLAQRSLALQLSSQPIVPIY